MLESWRVFVSLELDVKASVSAFRRGVVWSVGTVQWACQSGLSHPFWEIAFICGRAHHRPMTDGAAAGCLPLWPGNQRVTWLPLFRPTCVSTQVQLLNLAATRTEMNPSNRGRVTSRYIPVSMNHLRSLICFSQRAVPAKCNVSC